MQAALEAVTASQQLVPAIFALAMVTRPLLAVGLPPPEGEAMDLDAAAASDADAVKAEAQVPHGVRIMHVLAAAGCKRCLVAPGQRLSGVAVAALTTKSPNLSPTQERAALLVAGALQALLPAVDANDEAKTLAVFRFYCVALSSVPRLEVRKHRVLVHADTCSNRMSTSMTLPGRSPSSASSVSPFPACRAWMCGM